MDPPVPGGASGDLIQIANTQMQQLSQARTLAAQLELIHARVFVVPDADFPDAVKEGAEHLDRCIEESGERSFPRASVHEFQVNSAVHMRTKLPALMMRLRDATFEQLLASKNSNPNGLLFDSAGGLLEGSTVGGIFLAPLLSSLVPDIWAFAVNRVQLSVIYSLGRSVPGKLGGPPSNPISVVNHCVFQSVSAPSDEPGFEESDLHKTAFADSIEWWCARMSESVNDFYCPTFYQDRAGFYNPEQHQRWMLSWEQFLSRVAVIGRNHDDFGAALLAAMSALDIVGDHFRGSGNIGGLMRPGKIRRIIESVEARIPERARPVVLAPAKRALAAAEAVDAEFLVDLFPGESCDGRIEEFWNARRNATHGFTVFKQVLANHSGRLPADIVFVPYVYLLELLVDRRGPLARIERGL